MSLAAATMSMMGREEGMRVRRIWMMVARTSWTSRRGRLGHSEPPHQNTNTCSLEGRGHVGLSSKQPF